MSEYIKHITEDQKDSRKNGDVQIIQCDKKSKVAKKKIAKKMK